MKAEEARAEKVKIIYLFVYLFICLFVCLFVSYWVGCKG